MSYCAKPTAMKNSLLAWLLLMSIVSLNPASLAETPPPSSRTSLYVVIAGNGACQRKGILNLIPGLVDTQLFHAFANTLFQKGLVAPKDNVLFACYEWQSPQMKFYELRGSRQMFPTHESQLDSLVATRAPHYQRLVIIGHSHAGWRAMKLAASTTVLDAMNGPVLLATIDPVSRIHCQRLREPGCRHYPTDLSPQEFERLHTQTDWLNLYHEPAIILGSSSIPYAHHNLRIHANHVRMQTDPTVWKTIEQFIRSHHERN